MSLSEKKLEKKMIDLNFNLNSIGFHYWVTAVNHFDKTGPHRISSVYRMVAKIHGSTPSRVERAMRHASETAIPFIQDEYKLHVINNTTILNLLLLEVE